jgi:hypothetical protein
MLDDIFLHCILYIKYSTRYCTTIISLYQSGTQTLRHRFLVGVSYTLNNIGGSLTSRRSNERTTKSFSRCCYVYVKLRGWICQFRALVHSNTMISCGKESGGSLPAERVSVAGAVPGEYGFSRSRGIGCRVRGRMRNRSKHNMLKILHGEVTPGVVLYTLQMKWIQLIFL